MLKLYCQKCGALNSYVSEKPNFCQKCGQSFSTEQPAAPTSPQPEVKAQVADITTEDDEDTINFNNLSALDVDITPWKASTDQLGAIAGTANSGQLDNFAPPQGHTPYTMDDFKREAGSSKAQNEPEET